MDIKILWLSPEQPPDGQPRLMPDSEDAERQADIQQKQLSLIRHYRKQIAAKDEELQTLRAGFDQRHALIDQLRAELETLQQEKTTLKTMLRAKNDELAALRQSPSVVDTAKVQAEVKRLRQEHADMQAENVRLSRFYTTYCAEQHAALDKVLRDMAMN